jgi:hypothetical protein
MDVIEYYLDFLSILMFMVVLVVVIHAVMVIIWSYAETGSPLLYLQNFYHNVYHIDF